MRDTDLTDATWRTSSYSGGNGNCVEVADNLPDVRDTKDHSGPVLAFPPVAWKSFTASLRTETNQK